MTTFSNPDDTFNSLRQMIQQLANGEFAHRILLQQEPQNDIEEIAVDLNMLAEELADLFINKEAFGLKDMAHPLILVINTRFKIYGVNKRLARMLQRPSRRLLGKSLHKVLTQECVTSLQEILPSHLQMANNRAPLKCVLTLKIPDGQLQCWGYWHLLNTPEGYCFFFRGLPASIQDTATSTKNKASASTSGKAAQKQLQYDFNTIKEVQQYILEHLDQPLPSLPKLAKLFSTNEFKLKRGFRVLYHNSIFKFHLEKRLEVARLKIQNTPTSLKQIAQDHGFRNYSHFSKAFKARYGHKPSYFKNKKELF